MADATSFNYTAKGRYYKTYVDDVYQTQHTTEREAIEEANRLALANPDSKVSYKHEYEVEVDIVIGPFGAVINPIDLTPPAVPTGLATTATSASEITLGWIANSESDLVGYNIYRSEVSGVAGFAVVDSVLTNPDTNGYESYFDTGLTEGTQYWYYVTAYDDADPANESAGSSVSTSTTDSVNPPISNPDIVWTFDSDFGFTGTIGQGQSRSGPFVGVPFVREVSWGAKFEPLYDSTNQYQGSRAVRWSTTALGTDSNTSDWYDFRDEVSLRDLNNEYGGLYPLTQGDEHWYGWMCQMPTDSDWDLPMVPAFNTGYSVNIANLHYGYDGNLNPATYNCLLLQLGHEQQLINTGKISVGIFHQGDSRALSTYPGGMEYQVYRDQPGSYLIDDVTSYIGSWFPIVVAIKHSSVTGEGRIRIWWDGTLIYDTDVTSPGQCVTGIPDSPINGAISEVYWKWGIYNPMWGMVGQTPLFQPEANTTWHQPGQAEDRSLLADNFKYKKNGVYADVDPTI